MGDTRRLAQSWIMSAILYPYVYAVISCVSYGSQSTHCRFVTFHPFLFGEVVIFTIDTSQQRAVGRPCGSPNPAAPSQLYIDVEALLLVM